MISSDIKYSFKQIELGLIAMIGNLELKLQKIIPNLPVFVLQTGDFSYIINKKFIKTENKEIYQKVPRFVVGIEDIQYQTEQNSNKYNKVYYIFDEKNYVTQARRLAILIPINTDFISPNFVKALTNFEIMATIVSKENVFTYEFMGNTYEGGYAISSPSFEKPSMDTGSGTRNVSVKTIFDLQLQLLVPRINTIKLLSDTIIDKIVIDIDVKDEVDESDIEGSGIKFEMQ